MAGSSKGAGATKSAAGKKGGPAIMWFRNDLRLADNAALRAACEAGGKVLALFVLDREAGGDWAMGGASRWWLHGSLASLAAAIDKAGGTLVLREGRPADIVPALANEIGAVAVHCGLAHEPAVRESDAAVAGALPEDCPLVHHRVATMFDFDAARTKAGGVFGVYSPFAAACRALGEPPEPVAAPRRIDGVTGVKSDRLESWKLLPTKPDWAGGLRKTWEPGEAAAGARLKRFLAEHLDDYGAERDRPANEDGTSMLSPHLHWGELSPVQVWHAVAEAAEKGKRSAAKSGAKDGRATFENEVLWHEFAAYTLWHVPALPDSEVHDAYAKLPWRRDDKGLAAWQQGRTGIPIVDAGMRQLWQVGWMHNRVRMITASFLVKHLLVAWQTGEAWFWDTLVDADLATNAMSWQWIAGSGADASPFFRVFNPVTQAKKFDPDGDYVRRWVPELAGLEKRDVHAPWLAKADALERAGIALGQDYPAPIVDLDEGRDRALKAFRAHVKGSGNSRTKAGTSKAGKSTTGKSTAGAAKAGRRAAPGAGRDG